MRCLSLIVVAVLALPTLVRAEVVMGHLIFVTNISYALSSGATFPPSFPYIREVTGADLAVNNDAALAGLDSGLWKAIVSTEFENAIDRITVQGPVFNSRLELVALNETELFGGTLHNPVRYDNYGNQFAGQPPHAWTGTLPDGTWSGADWEGSRTSSATAPPATRSVLLASGCRPTCLDILIMECLMDFSSDWKACIYTASVP